jgi:hypothetical protein
LSGGTRAVPWAQVTGFEGGREKGEPVVLVLTSSGQRLQTGGYCPAGNSPSELWQLLRTLEGERLARTPGAVSALPPQPQPRKPLDPVGAFLLSSLGVIMLIVFGTVFMSMGITEIGPAIRAAHGGGTAGYFIPGPEPCGKCGWLGDFRLPDGTVTRRETHIDLSKSALHTGVPVTARDTGDPDTVFPRSDPGAWHGPVAVLFGASWCWAATLALIIRAVARRLRGSRGADEEDPPPAARPDATALARDAAAALAGQHGWSLSPPARPDQEQHRSIPQAGRRLSRLDGVLNGRPVAVVFWERFTSVVIVLPTGTVPKVRIKVDLDSGQLTFKEDVLFGQRLITPPAREVISQAGFAAVTFGKSVLGGGFPGVITADEVIDALHSLERLLAAMPGDVLRAHGVLTSGGAQGDHS